MLVHNLNCGKSGRGKKLAPDPKAKGTHTTFKRDPSGKVTHYTTFQPNSRNPSGFDEILRFDRVGKAMEGFLRPMSILLRKFVRLSCGKFHYKSGR